jgi:hypothetical protein
MPPALASAVDLTAQGTSDWSHWGLATNSLFNHKAGVVQQIRDFTKIGAYPLSLYADNYTRFSWNDGTPTVSTNNVTRGVFTTGVTNGFEFTVPADTTSRTLKVYVGLYGARGNFQAWLSDYSGAAFTDMTLSNSFDNAYGVYTLTYAAASAGQKLNVRYRSLNLFDQDYGNVTLQAATLVVNSGGNIVLENPAWSAGNFSFSFASQSGRAYEVQVTDDLSSGSWKALMNVTGDGSSLMVTDRNASVPGRAYRVQSR